MAVNIVIIIVIAILVLLSVSAFFLTSTTSGMTQTQATKIFGEACAQLRCGTSQGICMENYEQFQTKDFYNKFYEACSILHGEGRDNSFLCFSACGNCITLTAEQIQYIASRITACEPTDQPCRCSGIP